MTRPKTLKTAALNITTEPPHSAERYMNLVKSLYTTERLWGSVGGSDRLVPQWLGAQKGESFIGVFARYTQIDPTALWYDTVARKPVVDEKGVPVPQVKDGLGPNYKEIAFVFYADVHRLVFDCANISPGLFAKALRGMFSHDEVMREFGPVSVYVLPTSDALETLLKLKKKTKIEIKYTLPNGDLVKEEGRIMKRLEWLQASRVEKTITSQFGSELKLDLRLRAEMNIACTNGQVKVTGMGSDGVAQTKSTTDTPKIEKIRYDDTTEGYWDALGSAGDAFASGPGDGHGPDEQE